MLTPFSINTPTTKLTYRLYENALAEQPKTIVFIHGAGVGGEITWSDFLPYLTQWQRVVIPDLKGMGDSHSLKRQEEETSIHELSHDILYLLDHLQLCEFDLVGYSLGGLVSLSVNAELEKRVEKSTNNQADMMKVRKMALLEPAGLDREALSDLVTLRQRYKEAAHIIRATGDVELGVAKFVDSVSPNRRKHPIAEATTQSRLAHRPLGFAYALDAVTQFAESHQEHPTVREDLIKFAPATLLLSGDLSHELLREYHAVLAQKNTVWRSDVIKGTDHSLPFQKPRQIAKILNRWFAESH